MKTWLRKGCLACAGLAALGALIALVFGVVFLVQSGSENLESRELVQELPSRMDGGYLELDLAGMSVSSANVELVRGVLDLRVSEPLPAPMESLRVKSRVGTALLRSLGNASPRELQITHGVGAAMEALLGEFRRGKIADEDRCQFLDENGYDVMYRDELFFAHRRDGG